jgi:hypothetical protein
MVQVVVYAPPTTLQSEWDVAANLTEPLLQALGTVDWIGAAAAADGSNDDGTAVEGGEATLRLRGGSGVGELKRPAPPPANDASAPAAAPSKRQRGGRKPEAPKRSSNGDGDIVSSPVRPAHAAAAAAAAGGGPASAPASFGEYIVPPNFRRTDLPEVDLSSSKAVKTTVPLAFVRRFLNLRGNVPRSERPTYDTPSQHLKGSDAELLNRVLAETWHVYGTQLHEAGLDTGKYSTEARRVLRLSWDRMKDELKKGFILDPIAEVMSDEEDATAAATTTAAAAGGPMIIPAKSSGVEPVLAVVEAELVPFEVPEGFSGEHLPPVDTTDKTTMRRSLFMGAVKRFLELRAEVGACFLSFFPRRSLF